MRTKKSSPCGRSPGSMDLATARMQVRACMQEIVQEWRQQHSTLLHQSAGQIIFLEDFSLCRLENGCIQSVSPYGYPFMPREADIGIETFMHWLIPAAIMRIRMLVLAELNRLTGRKSINPLDLGPLLQDCGMLVNILIGDPEHPYDVQSLGKKLRAFLDPEVLKIAHRTRDTFNSLALYNTIAANRETWLALEAQSPSLMPLVSYACRKKQIHFDQNVFRSLKKYARRHGLTETGWKALCNFPVEHVNHLLQYSLEDCFRAAPTLANQVCCHRSR